MTGYLRGSEVIPAAQELLGLAVGSVEHAEKIVRRNRNSDEAWVRYFAALSLAASRLRDVASIIDSYVEQFNEK